MKRVGGLFEDIADFGNLYRAYLRARSTDRSPEHGTARPASRAGRPAE